MIQDKNQLSTRLSRISRGKIIIKRTATILVLLSSFFPFANNLVKRFYDTSAIVLDNVSGARKLDVDDCIFFLSIPVSYLLIAIGSRAGAHKYSYIAVYVSCYFQFAFLINFIFLDKNELFFYSQSGMLFIFIAIAAVLFFTERYLKKIAIADEFKEKSLDRSLSILTKREKNESTE